MFALCALGDRARSTAQALPHTSNSSKKGTKHPESTTHTHSGMAPIEPMCKSLDCGVHTGTGYADNDGHMHPSRPDERHGLAGGFTHGTTILAGGVPSAAVKPESGNIQNHGTVLYTSDKLRPDVSGEQATKPGTDDCERVGRSGSNAHWEARRVSPDAGVSHELNHGTVLYTSDKLRPNMAVEQATKPGTDDCERVGRSGSFAAGVNVRAGGPARAELTPMAPELKHGTVLAECPNLRADMSYDDAHCKPGTDNCERQGRSGSFAHGDAHLRGPLPAAEAWEEAGQTKGARRFGPGHHSAGATIGAGGAQNYCAT